MNKWGPMNQLNWISLWDFSHYFYYYRYRLFINWLSTSACLVGWFLWFLLISLAFFYAITLLIASIGLVSSSKEWLFQRMVALVFAITYCQRLQDLADCLSVTQGICHLSLDFVLRKASISFTRGRLEELSKRYIFFALLQLFIGLFLIASPLRLASFLIKYYWLDFSSF